MIEVVIRVTDRTSNRESFAGSYIDDADDRDANDLVLQLLKAALKGLTEKKETK